MTRLATQGVEVPAQFPVFESDGKTKKSGESSFTTRFWRDGVVITQSSVIAEIGSSGEYLLTFSPANVGIYTVEVEIAYNDEIWFQEYDVRKPILEFRYSAAEGAVNATFSVWAEQDGERVTDLDSIAAVIRTSDGSAVVDLGTNSSDTSHGIFAFSTTKTNLTDGTEYYLDITATRGALTWPANLGFAKA